jgi:2-polyprenyl-3-methyl-5-hydroxy-6-metoxy-1,4-benzoquinol methylase
MPVFSKRSTDVEIMDDLACSGEVVHQTLRELETINYLLGGNYVTLDGINQLLGGRLNGPIRIVDLGCGSGDILRLIRRWSSKKAWNLQLTGIDANPFIVNYALEHTPSSYNIQYEVNDIFSKRFQTEKFDVVVGTLFFHHFSDGQLINFFRQLKHQARIGVVINDIHRNWFSYYSIKWLTRFLSKSSMVKFDAPLSVLRAFTKPELIEILKQAGLVNYTIKWMWAFRWQVVIRME